MTSDNITFAKLSPFPLLSLSNSNTYTFAVIGVGKSNRSPFTMAGRAQCVHVYVLSHPSLIYRSMTKRKVAAPAVSCDVLKLYLSR